PRRSRARFAFRSLSCDTSQLENQPRILRWTENNAGLLAPPSSCPAALLLQAVTPCYPIEHPTRCQALRGRICFSASPATRFRVSSVRWDERLPALEVVAVEDGAEYAAASEFQGRLTQAGQIVEVCP